MTTAHHPIVVAGIPKSIPKLIIHANTVVAAFGANTTLFPSPSPSLAQVLAAIQALEQAHTAAQTKAQGAAQVRDVKAKTVENHINGLAAYTQVIVNANPDQEESIARAAGFKLKRVGRRSLPPLEVALGQAPGSVDLKANKAVKKGARVFHDWQSSVDGGKTWLSSQSTNDANTTITGLTPLTVVSFRHRVNHRNKPGPWSQVVSIVVQ